MDPAQYMMMQQQQQVQYQQQLQQHQQQQQAQQQQVAQAQAMEQAYQLQLQQQQKLLLAAAPPKKPPSGDAGITGLCAVTTRALTPVAHMDPEWTLEDMAFKVCGHIGKAAARYWQSEDEKYVTRASVAKGQAIIEEFVMECMYAINQTMHARPWFHEANFTDPLYHAIMSTFENKMQTFMSRLLKPVIQKTIDDAVARFREEERIQKALYEAVQISGLPEAHHKKCRQHLEHSYDRAHMGASYGSTKAASVELGLVQDFVKGWMETFCHRAWSVLNDGVSNDIEEQYAFLTTLFQHLTDPEQCCLPFELVSQPGAMPPENWAFVAEAAMQILKGEEQPGQGQIKKKLRLA